MNWQETACNVGKNFCPRMLIESILVKARVVLVTVEVGDGYSGSLCHSFPLCLKCFETKKRIESIKVQ